MTYRIKKKKNLNVDALLQRVNEHHHVLMTNQQVIHAVQTRLDALSLLVDQMKERITPTNQ